MAPNCCNEVQPLCVYSDQSLSSSLPEQQTDLYWRRSSLEQSDSVHTFLLRSTGRLKRPIRSAVSSRPTCTARNAVNTSLITIIISHCRRDDMIFISNFHYSTLNCAVYKTGPAGSSIMIQLNVFYFIKSKFSELLS